MVIKRTIAHKEDFAVPVNFIKADWAGKIVREVDGVERIKAGTLLELKTSAEDIRINGKNVIPFLGTGKAVAVLLNDVEFKISTHTNETGTALVEGIVYLDKLIEVESTVDKTKLPVGITYVNKNRQ